MRIIIAIFAISLVTASVYYDPDFSDYSLPSAEETIYIDGNLPLGCPGGSSSYRVNERDCGGSDGTVAFRKFSDYYVHNYQNKDYESERVLVRGGTYHDTFQFVETGYHDWPDSESERHYLLAYDPVDEPVIVDASPSLGAWQLHSGNVWKVAVSKTIRSVVVDENHKSMKGSVADLSIDGDWYYGEGTLYLYSISDPDGRDIISVIDDNYGSNALDTTNNPSYGQVQYITIKGLIFQGASQNGISAEGENLVIEGCEARFNGKGGILIHGKDNLVSRNYVHDNILRNWPRGTWSGGEGYACNPNGGGWPFALGGSGGAANAVFSGNVVKENGGEGIGIYGPGNRNATISDNIVENSWSVGIYLDDFSGARVYRNFLYCDGFRPEDIWTGCTGAEWNRACRRTLMDGILVGNEYYGDGFNADDFKIYNNLIVNCRSGFSSYIVTSVNGYLRNMVFSGNTVVMGDNDPRVCEGNGIGISINGITIAYYGGRNTNNVIKNNVVLTGHDSQRAVYIEDAREAGVAFSNNLYFHYGTEGKRIWYKGSERSFSEWQETGAKNIDPLGEVAYDSERRKEILALTGIDIASYYPTDVVVNQGVDVSYYLDDFDGRERSIYDIGAFEYPGELADQDLLLAIERWKRGEITIAALLDAIMIWKGS